MLKAGVRESAWQRLSLLHPADMGGILAGLPTTSRDSLLRLMHPDTVSWMLRQMNPS